MNLHPRMRRRIQLALETQAPHKRGPGVGAWKPGQVILIVGDRPAKHHEDLPFCSELRTGCSWWLAEQLDSANIEEESLYWVNSMNHLGKGLSCKFIEQLEPFAVVALGKNAQKWCQVADIGHYVQYHPQYWKRFRAKDRQYPLLSLLKGLQHDLSVKQVAASKPHGA